MTIHIWPTPYAWSLIAIDPRCERETLGALPISEHADPLWTRTVLARACALSGGFADEAVA